MAKSKSRKKSGRDLVDWPAAARKAWVTRRRNDRAEKRAKAARARARAARKAGVTAAATA